MDAVEYVKQRKRMCDYYVACSLCPAGQCKGCASLDEIPNVVPIVEQWAKEHPVKTRQNELLKMFPNADMHNGVLEFCPQRFGYFRDNRKCCEPTTECVECRRDFWLKEIE